jgi:alpha-L-fucosidase
VPATLNDTWGFNRDDHNWKNPDDIIRLLLKINSRGGNYLLNIGPDGLGQVPAESIQILDRVGAYVRENKEAIFGTRTLPSYPYDLDWAVFTGKPHRLYVHVVKGQRRELYFLNIGNRVKQATLVKNGESLPFECTRTCEGDSAVIVSLPPSLREKHGYCIALHTEEDEPVFEPIRI